MLLLGFLLGALVSTTDPAIPSDCPVTRPDAGVFVPPPPYDRVAFPRRFWYGTERLWALPFSDGVWRGTWRGDGVFDKVFWWSQAWDWKRDHQPALAVTARRLDSHAEPVKASRATNAHNDEDINHAMLVGMTIPTSGCWELAGEYKGETLAYVVWFP